MPKGAATKRWLRFCSERGTKTLGLFRQFSAPIASDARGLAAMAAVLDHVAEGEITPDEGATVAGILEVKRRTLELVDLEARILALETAKESRR